MRLVEAIRRANAPRPPEESVPLRLACTGAVLVAVVAASAVGQLTWPEGLTAAALVAAGMAFSWATRASPPGWVKVAVAAGAIGAIAWFGLRIDSGPVTDITALESALTVLFVAILVVHSFHVPATTDLLFALVASGGLMAVDAARAVDLGFALPLLAWAALSWWALVERWRSASGARSSGRGIGAALACTALVAVGTFLWLPAPSVSARLDILSRSPIGGPVRVPLAGALAGDNGHPEELSSPGSRNGPTRVGGYLGFAGDLDTAIRGTLGHQVVMRVRASRPSYWVGETFDTWNGQSWSQSRPARRALRGGSPFEIPVPRDQPPGGRGDLQTFYLAQASADLVFHAGRAAEVWFPSSTLFVGGDGTLISPVGIGRGAVYTVESEVDDPGPAALASASGPGLPAGELRRYTELPRPYRRVARLARTVTAGDTSTYAEVESLIGWIAAHTHYTTDIPPLPPGADTVDEFLFGNRLGYCEQISTSLAVMLRTLGVPVREVVGYVPGSYDPITGLYAVEADDAHAWVQVWFPGYGWQDFDPTASVPLATPSPAQATLAAVGRALGHLPVAPTAAALGVVVALAAALQWYRRRPADWMEKVARNLERAGRSAGLPRRRGETLVSYASALDNLAGSNGSGDDGQSLVRLATLVEAVAYGGAVPSPEQRRRAVARSRRPLEGDLSRRPLWGAVSRRACRGTVPSGGGTRP